MAEQRDLTESELDAFMDASAAVLGLRIAPEWRGGVRGNLAMTLRMHGLLAGFALPDEAEPAPVFVA